MNDMSMNDLGEHAFEREADTHIWLWRAESPEHAEEICEHINCEMPVNADSIFDLYSEMMLSETSGILMLRYDPELMTEEDVLAAEQWLRDFPSNEIEYIPCAMMKFIHRIGVHDDDCTDQQATYH